MGNNSLEFFVKMRDMMSSGLVKMAATAKKTFDNVQKSVNQVTSRNKILGQSFDTLGSKIAQVESVIRTSTIPSQIRAARSELEKLNAIKAKHPGNIDNSTSSTGSGFMRSLIGPALIASSIAAATSVFSAGAKREQDIVGLRTFLGKGAEGAYANIQKDAAATPFNTESLLNVNRALITTGMSAEAARKDTLNLANAVAASGKGDVELERMAANMAQIKNLGKASLVDIKQFGVAGINIYGVLASAIYKTNTPTQQQLKSVQEMEISYDLLSFALDKAAKKGGIFENALTNMSVTVAGRWSTFMDTFSIGAASIGEQLQPMMHALLDIGMVIADKVVPAAVELVKWITENWNWIGLLASVIAGAVAGYWAVILATKAWAFAQTLLNVAMSLNPIALVVAAVAALTVGIIYAWNTFEGFRKVVYGLWEAFKQVFENIGSFFKKTFEPIFEAIRLFKDGKFLEASVVLAKSPLTMASNAAKFTLGGGFTKGVSDAYLRGSEKGKDAKLSSIAAAGAEMAGSSSSSYSTSAADAIGEKITSGGPRVININGVKFADKIEIVAQTLDEAVEDLESKFQDMFLRILNSGASLQ